MLVKMFYIGSINFNVFMLEFCVTDQPESLKLNPIENVWSNLDALHLESI